MIKNMMFWVPRSGDVAIGISIISYAGNVSLGIATDTRVAPDPEKITEYFSDDFSTSSNWRRRMYCTDFYKLPISQQS